MTVEEAIEELKKLPLKSELFDHESQWGSFFPVRHFKSIKLVKMLKKSEYGEHIVYAEANPDWCEKRLNGKKIVDVVVVNY